MAYFYNWSSQREKFQWIYWCRIKPYMIYYYYYFFFSKYISQKGLQKYQVRARFPFFFSFLKCCNKSDKLRRKIFLQHIQSHQTAKDMKKKIVIEMSKLITWLQHTFPREKQLMYLDGVPPMLWNSKTTHSNSKVKLRTFRVAAYTMYSKDPVVSSGKSCVINIFLSVLAVIWHFLKAGCKLHGNKISRKDGEG